MSKPPKIKVNTSTAPEISSQISLSARAIWLRIGVVAAALLIIFAVLNFPYIWKNLFYSFSHPPAASTQSPDPSVAAQQGQPDLLEIPSLDISAPIVYITERSEKAYQAALLNGVVHFPGTADIGQPGNPYIFGHSSDFVWSKGKYKTVFALLPRIKDRAEIRVSDHSGTVYTYKVFKQVVVGPNDVSVLDQGNNEKKLLSIQTSYPVGTALRRYVVVAELIH